MTLSEIYAKLDNLENGKELIAGIQQHIQSVNEEAKRNRENWQVEKERAKTAEEQLSEYTKEGKTVGEWKADVNQLQKQMNELKEKYETAEKEREAERSKRIQATLQNAVIGELQKANCINPQEIGKIIMSQVSMGENDTIVYGEDKTLEDGISEYLKANTWAVSNTATAGSGANAPKTSVDINSLTYSEMIALKAKQPELFNE